ncbi:MAG TPA: hypothetical protein VG365_01285 [Solirubrobacteraceae bacterium]|jgi:hypothetical protein|nr:hypothetical protein [Solirubrobacteraceae bacterium]
MSSDYILSYGTHARPEDGRCAMEWVSHLAGEPHSDEPACVSPVLRAMCIALNDGLEHTPRQRLRPYLARTIGTADDGFDTERGWMAMDWLVRVYTPAWLHTAGLTEAGAALSALAPVGDGESLQSALAVLDDARRLARAARARMFGVPHPTGWAASIASGLAGREAAWACAGAAAWAAARVSIGDATGDRARAAARAAAGDAAAIAVRQSRTAARHGGARDAARSVLAPALASLTDSALDLLDRMLPTELLALPQPTRRGDTSTILA